MEMLLWKTIILNTYSKYITVDFLQNEFSLRRQFSQLKKRFAVKTVFSSIIQSEFYIFSLLQIYEKLLMHKYE